MSSRAESISSRSVATEILELWKAVDKAGAAGEGGGNYRKRHCLLGERNREIQLLGGSRFTEAALDFLPNAGTGESTEESSPGTRVCAPSLSFPFPRLLSGVLSFPCLCGFTGRLRYVNRTSLESKATGHQVS